MCKSQIPYYTWTHAKLNARVKNNKDKPMQRRYLSIASAFKAWRLKLCSNISPSQWFFFVSLNPVLTQGEGTVPVIMYTVLKQRSNSKTVYAQKNHCDEDNTSIILGFI